LSREAAAAIGATCGRRFAAENSQLQKSQAWKYVAPALMLRVLITALKIFRS